MKVLLVAAMCLPVLGACVMLDVEERPSARIQAPQAGAPAALLGADNPYPVVDINLRRTTLIVKDADASLKLYRDALGFSVVYDQELTSPGLMTRHGADGQNRSRLVLTQTNSGELGMIGIWQFLDQTEKDTAPADTADFTPGEIVLLFHTENLQERFDAAAAVPGVTVLGSPTERRYPSPAGDIVVMVSMLVDPDGHTIELNQKIFDPRDAR